MSSAQAGSGQPFRTASGGVVDRSRRLRFSFDGRAYDGFAGDTLASALLANGVRLVGRSFKYHRPRGILSAGPEEPNALVELRTGARREPNIAATTVELHDGLEAASQNRQLSLRFDPLALVGPFASFMTAGFYYKTFMWPRSFWEKFYEPLIRRAAGLGRAAGEDDPDHYEKAIAFCDVLVIGGGPAGLAAALAAGRTGARVILCESDFALGGRLLAERTEIEGRPAVDWLRDAEAELKNLPEVRVMRRTTVFGVYDHGTYGALERVSDHLPVPPPHRPRQRAWRIVARRAVLAAGAIERPIVFGGNDRPGVMLAGAVRTYLHRFGVAPAKRAVIFTACDDGWLTARDLAGAGVPVTIVDARREVDPALAARQGVRVILGGRVTRVHGAHEIRAVTVTDGAGRVERVSCDLLAVSNGWSPTVHLTCHLGGKPVWNDALHAFVPGRLPPGLSVVGAAAGRLTLAEALATGGELGRQAAADCGFARPHKPLIPAQAGTQPAPAATDDHVSSTSARLPSDGSLNPLGPRLRGDERIGIGSTERTGLSPLWRVKGSRGKAFVDFQNDVSDKDIELAQREGFGAAEHLKRYTTLGMATDQGKTANVAALAIMAEISGRPIAELGATVFRPPYTPVAIGALAGHHRGKDYRPTRLTPSHDWAKEQGAVFVETGMWLRAQYFPRGGESDWLATVSREVTTVRSAVGVCDVSTLGKIDIQGADAAEFLERVYCNAWKSLAVGRARYGLMLREDGIVMDDGTTSRLGERHFLMTTTTANAAKIMQHLEFCHQVLWPRLDVQMVSVTEQWAQFSVAGPRARDVLSGIVDRQHDLSNEAFPYLAARAVTVGGGIAARLFRISFSGELAYELAVPADYGDAAVRAIMAAGEPFGIAPYGTEALGVMRIEKGHVAGNEISGQTTARDLGLGRMMSTKKDYVGRGLAERPGLTDPDRPSFIGFKPVKRGERLRAGAHFIPLGRSAVAEHDEGYMTSVAFSPTLGHWIGLGLLKHGPARIGERVRAVDLLRGSDIEVEICHPVFVDPGEEKLRV